MIRLWNTLTIDVRQKSISPDFLECMHKKYKIHQYKQMNLFHYDTEIDNIYLKLRFHYSTLKADQYKFQFVPNSFCEQCNKNKQETIHHYFMDCEKYNQPRIQLKQNIRNLHNHFEQLTNRQLIHIIQGSREDNIEQSIYKNIYQFIKLYIVLTGRFVA